MEVSVSWWVGFNVLVLVLLALDLGVFQRKAHAVGFWEAVWFSVLWLVLALVFNLLILLGWVGGYSPAERGKAAMEFLTGYLIERSLSFDNLFVFAVIFGYFKVPAQYQHRVLFLGILGALVFRAIFIFGGVALIHHFEWMLWIFGLFLLWTGYKLATTKEREIEPEKNPIIRFTRRMLPFSDRYDGGRFITRVDGKRLGTPLLLVVIFLETTDVIFAIDSIPAIIAITRDPFIIYTSNVFAILGLRAIFFVLAAIMRIFRYLNAGLAALMVFIGAKMLLDASGAYHMDSWLSLVIIAAILAVAIIASLANPLPPSDLPSQAPAQPSDAH